MPHIEVIAPTSIRAETSIPTIDGYRIYGFESDMKTVCYLVDGDARAVISCEDARASIKSGQCEGYAYGPGSVISQEYSDKGSLTLKTVVGGLLACSLIAFFGKD